MTTCTCAVDKSDNHSTSCAVTIEQYALLNTLLTKRAVDAVNKACASLERAKTKLNDIRKRRTILCSCGKMHAINELALRVTHYYEEPHGCTGGDYWSEGEWQFVCPATGVFNRLLFDDYHTVDYKKRHVIGVAAEPTFKSLYRNLFASSTDIHERRCSGNWMNNYYVDRHREYFELPLSK